MQSIGRGDISKEDKHKILSANGGDVNSAVQSLTCLDDMKYSVSSSNQSTFEKQWEERSGEITFVSGVSGKGSVRLSNIKKGESGVICIFITFKHG